MYTLNQLSNELHKLVMGMLLILLIIAVAVLVIIIIRALYRLRKNGIDICLENHASGIILGRIGPLVVCSPENAEPHVAVWGGSGTGKTRSIVLPTLNHWGQNNTVFAIDVSGDISSNIHNRNSIIFEPGRSTIPYNPLYEADFADGKQATIYSLDNLVDAIMPPKDIPDGNESFFYDSGRLLLKASFYLFYPKGLDFCDICKKICELSPEDLRDKILESGNPTAIMRISSLSDIKESTLASCKNQADNAVYLFATDESIRKAVRRPQENEEYIVPELLEKCSLFIVLSESESRLYRDLMHLITGQCFQYVFSRRLYPKNKILFCLDEFSSLGFLDIEKPLDKFRKSGARIMILSQSPLHVDIAYSSVKRKAMSENLRIQVILGSVVPSVQKELAELIGHKRNILGLQTDEMVDPSELSAMEDYLYLVYPGGSIKMKKI